MSNQSEIINQQSRVTMHHKLGLTDGTVFEDTFDQDPMVIQLGSGELAEGLELALLELKAGDEQVIDINPDLAFGFVDESLITDMKRAEFPEEVELQQGLIMEFSTPSGEFVPGTILEFDEDTVKVDLNHPLAGQTIRYTVKIIEVDNQPHVLN